MLVEIHSLSWPGSDPRLSACQAKVFNHFHLPILQHRIQMDHGAWMDALLMKSKADVLLFVDNDCIPLYRDAVIEAVRFAYRRQSFLGLAQASNHINAGQHVFAAPAFLAIATEAWKRLGCPSCRANHRSDVAEELSWRAEDQGLIYRAWYPTHYSHSSQSGLWRLGNYGYFGIGTVFAQRIFHLYQGRLSENVDLFANVCDRVVASSFSTVGMKSACDADL